MQGYICKLNGYSFSIALVGTKWHSDWKTNVVEKILRLTCGDAIERKSYEKRMTRTVESGNKMMINWFRGQQQQRQKDIRRRLIQAKVPSSQVEAAKKKKK